MNSRASVTELERIAIEQSRRELIEKVIALAEGGSMEDHQPRLAPAAGAEPHRACRLAGYRGGWHDPAGRLRPGY